MINLCANCLQDGAVGVDVGAEKGTQRDPYREAVQLCPTCAEALSRGDFEAIHERFAESRTIERN